MQGESISYFARWTDRYKEAREYLYGTMEAEPDEEAAHEIMLEEERFMRRALAVRQIKKWQMCGTKKH